MPTETLEHALARLDAGDLDGARSLARPLLLSHDTRADGLYILGRAYQLENKPHIALYLFEQAAMRVCPSDTTGYLDECKARVEAAGWTEDFADGGHALCAACRLYYRGEYASCPYCSGANSPESADNRYEGVIGNKDLGWEDDLLDKAEKAGREVVGKAKEIADSKMGERARAIGKEAAEKARAFAGREDVKKATERAKDMGKEAGESVRKVFDSETAKGVQVTARETGQSLAHHVRAFVNEERSRYLAADENRKRAIVVKWILIGFAGLAALQVLSWLL